MSVLRKFFISMAALAAMLGVFLTGALAGPVNVDGNGLALEGNDPVAYFTEGKPVKGNASFRVKHGDAIYQFASTDHQALFEANPEKYLPQYGGFCAFGMASGYQAPVEVDKFTIVDDKLYLNYNGDVQSQWRKDIPGYLSKANANWLKQ